MKFNKFRALVAAAPVEWDDLDVYQEGCDCINLSGNLTRDRLGDKYVVMINLSPPCHDLESVRIEEERLIRHSCSCGDWTFDVTFEALMTATDMSEPLRAVRKAFEKHVTESEGGAK